MAAWLAKSAADASSWVTIRNRHSVSYRLNGGVWSRLDANRVAAQAALRRSNRCSRQTNLKVHRIHIWSRWSLNKCEKIRWCFGSFSFSLWFSLMAYPLFASSKLALDSPSISEGCCAQWCSSTIVEFVDRLGPNSERDDYSRIAVTFNNLLDQRVFQVICPENCLCKNQRSTSRSDLRQWIQTEFSWSVGAQLQSYATA